MRQTPAKRKYPRDNISICLISVVCDGKKRGVDYGYCCSPFNKCPIDHGDCDSDADCLSGLKCGIDNCRMEWGFIWNSDCCYRE